MDVEIHSEARVQETLSHPLAGRMCFVLMGYRKSAISKRARKVYGCRHCVRAGNTALPAETNGPSVESTTNQVASENPTTAKGHFGRKRRTIMDFVGLSSHLATK